MDRTELPAEQPTPAGRSLTRASLWIASCAAGVLVLALCRAQLLDALPLYDNTEGRYAASSLAMTRSGDWITPVVHHHGEQVPFLGKPPLGLWMTSLSLRWFGVSEWAARLPSFLCGLLLLWLSFRAASRVYGRDVAWLAVFVQASSLLFLGLWGSVTLDVFASLCVAGAVVSFLLAATEAARERRLAWGLGAFAWLGLGMLAKGPIVPILTAGSILPYCALARRWDLLRGLPWLSGTLLALAICVPWYVLAELHNPGFLRYFLIQENILRYLTPEYGDLYGRPHLRPYGTVWGFLLLAMLPWPLLLLRRAIWRRARGAWQEPRDRWSWLFLFWGLAPAIFFTFATSVLPTYLLPGIGGLSVLIAREISQQLGKPGFARRALAFVIAPHLLLLWSAVAWAIAAAGHAAASPLGAAAAVLFSAAALAAWRGQLAQGVPVLLALIMAATLGVLSRDLPTEATHSNSTRDVMAAARRDLEVGGRITVLGGGEPSMQFYALGLVSYMPADHAKLRVRVHDPIADVFVVRSSGVPVVTRVAPCLRESAHFVEFSVLLDRACREQTQHPDLSAELGAELGAAVSASAPQRTRP